MRVRISRCLLVLAVVLAGCGARDVPSDAAPSSTASARVKVFFAYGDAGRTCTRVRARLRDVSPPAVLSGAMSALLRGPTRGERRRGYRGWFSSRTAGRLRSVAVRDGVARIDFRDFRRVIPNASTSCGSALLLAQLNRTALQFPTVTRAVYSFNGDVAAFYEWLQRPAPRVGAAARADLITYSRQSGERVHLWQLDVETRARRRLTNGRYGEETGQWSSDGRRLVYLDTRRVRVLGLESPQITGVVATKDMQTHRVKLITTGAWFDEDPTWSPDARRIAFTRTNWLSGTPSWPEIWIMRSNGRGARQLTHNSVGDWGPAFSPSGRRIAFSRSRGHDTNTTDIWVMRADGSHQRRLVRNGTRPAWSPDGRRVAYGRLTGKIQGCCPVTNLNIVDGDGKHRTLVVRDGGRPAWSPDGRRIVFQRVDGRRSHIWIVNADGSGLRRLTKGRSSEYAAAWRP